MSLNTGFLKERHAQECHKQNSSMPVNKQSEEKENDNEMYKTVKCGMQSGSSSEKIETTTKRLVGKKRSGSGDCASSLQMHERAMAEGRNVWEDNIHQYSIKLEFTVKRRVYNFSVLKAHRRTRNCEWLEAAEGSLNGWRNLLNWSKHIGEHSRKCRRQQETW